MANPYYGANLENLTRTFQDIQDNPIINDIDVELTFDSEGGNFPVVYASFDISKLVGFGMDFSPSTDAMHQQVCENKGKLIKEKKKSLDGFFKEHGLVPFPIDSFSEEGVFSVGYVQSPRFHDFERAYDVEENLYFARRHLLVDENVRVAAVKSGFKPILDEELRLTLTRELYENLDGENGFLANLKSGIEGYVPAIPTFEQYQRFYNWAKDNDSKMWEGFADIELVRHDDSYGLAYCTDKPELGEVGHLPESSFGKIRIVEVKG